MYVAPYREIDNDSILVFDVVRSEIESRRERLRQRREILGIARRQHEDELLLVDEIERQVSEER